MLLTPSIRSRANMSSRLGPVVPLVLACASVWQEPHFDVNSTLPWTTLAVGCLTAQPASSDEHERAERGDGEAPGKS